MKLHMTEEEIAADYRQAKDPEAQIKILADLNCTSEDVIREIVTRLGAVRDAKERERADRDAKIGELYAQGLTDRQIADRLGIKSYTVGNWRQKHGHLCNPAKESMPAAGSKTKAVSAPRAPLDSGKPAVDQSAESSHDILSREQPTGTIYISIETILSNVPHDAGRCVRMAALGLALQMMDEYLRRRLRLTKEDERDE